MAITAASCSGSDGGEPERPASTRDRPAAAAQAVTGPLCELLPAGSDPGAPASLTGEPADVALQWIPVLTTFEAAVRAAGLAAGPRKSADVTILAPTDGVLGRLPEHAADAEPGDG